MFHRGAGVGARRKRYVAGALWCALPLLSAVLLLGMTPGPAGDADGPAVLPGATRSDPTTTSPGVPAIADESRPNIVVIMLDDMRADDLDGPWMQQTRRLLGAQGVRFANTVVPLPLCCPARSSFLTGQYPHNHGVWAHSEPWGYPALDDRETLPVWLQRAGYNTAFLGKYLNDYRGQHPDTGAIDGTFYVPPGWSDWKASLASTARTTTGTPRSTTTGACAGSTGSTRRARTAGSASR